MLPSASSSASPSAPASSLPIKRDTHPAQQRLRELRALIASNGFAGTFQDPERYRMSLLETIDAPY